MKDVLNRRPIVLALAGPNGAGKTSFYRTYLRPSGLRFVNADLMASALGADAYRAAKLADEVRRELIAQRESFIFETVLSDPVGDKVSFLKQAELLGYTVVLFFIGIESAKTSDDRVALRVSRGGHDVPREKLVERFPRIMENLKRALVELGNVRVYDNTDLRRPYRLVAMRQDGGPVERFTPVPKWLQPLLP